MLYALLLCLLLPPLTPWILGLWLVIDARRHEAWERRQREARLALGLKSGERP